MKERYFICEHLHKEQVVHGSICNVDAENIFLNNGYRAIQFPYTFSFSVKAKLSRFLYLLKIVSTVPAGAIVVFQFPLYARIHMLLVKLLRWKKVQIICLIADIEGLRNLDDRLLQKEKQALLPFKWFIVHNESMVQWLQSVVPHARMATIEFFDFFARPLTTIHSKTYEVVFAGNLEKSPFIYQLGNIYSTCPQVRFNIYGPAYRQPAMEASNANYKGVFEVHDLIDQLQGSFGLIWDGDSIETCAGSYGEYLAYNSPHKLSLYILAGLPIIAPDMSASADLIKKYGIGITIDRLSDIEAAINTISDTDYRQMIYNMRPLAERIMNGQCLGHALATIEDAILKKEG